MLGVFTGDLLRRSDLSGNRKTGVLLGAALVSLALCLAWSTWCPVNKKMWTSTFILAAASYSFALLALFYWVIDVKGWRRWTFFFRVIGMNSITIYMLMAFVGFQALSQRFFVGIAELGNAYWGMMVYALGQVAIEWLVLLWMYRKGAFLKV
jgi:predicted acyltransferase